MKLGVDVGLGSRPIELEGDSVTPSKRSTAPNFWPMSIVVQMAGWIKMPLGMELGLGQGDIVLDGDPAPPKKGYSPPNFRPMFIVDKRLNGSICHLVRRYASAQTTLC